MLKKKSVTEKDTIINTKDILKGPRAAFTDLQERYAVTLMYLHGHLWPSGIRTIIVSWQTD